MESKTKIHLSVISTSILVAVSSIAGISSVWMKNPYDVVNIFGDSVTLFGGGIYRYQTVSQVYQVVAHDLVNLFIALPSFLFSYWYMQKRSSFFARFLFIAIALYYAFTFGIYTFFSVFNDLFLVNVALLGLTFYLFLGQLLNLSWEDAPKAFQPQYPKKVLGTYLVIVSSLMAFFWVLQARPVVIGGSGPSALLEVGTTLVPHAIDLAFLLPVAFIAGLKLFRGHCSGYVAAIILPFFLIFMMSSVIAKGVFLELTATERAIEMIVFMGIFLLVSVIMVIINYKYKIPISKDSGVM